MMINGLHAYDTTTNTNNTSSSTSSSSSSSRPMVIDPNDFMTLLVAEIQNQDPTQPMDPTTFMSQLVRIEPTRTSDGYQPGRAAICHPRQRPRVPRPQQIRRRNMGSFSTSLSGLDAEEQALSVISNDLSNLNTTAFKTGTPVFSDLFYQMLGTDGAGDPVQVGVGATMSSVSSPMTQGNITTTGVPTDVAIQGNGLFVLDQNGTQVYTRAGNFTLNRPGKSGGQQRQQRDGLPRRERRHQHQPVPFPHRHFQRPNLSSQRHFQDATGYEPGRHGHIARAGDRDSHGAAPRPSPRRARPQPSGERPTPSRQPSRPKAAADTVLIGADVAIDPCQPGGRHQCVLDRRAGGRHHLRHRHRRQRLGHGHVQRPPRSTCKPSIPGRLAIPLPPRPPGLPVHSEPQT